MSTQIFWFATRGAGIVSLLLFTGVVLLGILGAGRWQRPDWPRVLTTGLHRNVALLALVFLGLHIATAVLDPFTALGPIAALVPGASTYRPFWVGLGVIAVDLVIALVLTSEFRRFIGPRAWRAVHWAAYAAWPLALAHGIGSGTDTGLGMIVVNALAAGAVAAATAWRIYVRRTAPVVAPRAVASARTTGVGVEAG